MGKIAKMWNVRKGREANKEEATLSESHYIAKARNIHSNSHILVHINGTFFE